MDVWKRDILEATVLHEIIKDRYSDGQKLQIYIDGFSKSENYRCGVLIFTRTNIRTK